MPIALCFDVKLNEWRAAQTPDQARGSHGYLAICFMRTDIAPSARATLMAGLVGPQIVVNHVGSEELLEKWHIPSVFPEESQLPTKSVRGITTDAPTFNPETHIEWVDIVPAPKDLLYAELLQKVQSTPPETCKFCGQEVVEGLGGHTSSCYERMMNEQRAETVKWRDQVMELATDKGRLMGALGTVLLLKDSPSDINWESLGKMLDGMKADI